MKAIRYLTIIVMLVLTTLGTAQTASAVDDPDSPRLPDLMVSQIRNEYDASGWNMVFTIVNLGQHPAGPFHIAILD